jgi:membrane associated rhomboid family serine protease
MMALAINWAGAEAAGRLFVLLAGDSVAVLHGQLWRLVTAALLHSPNSPTHALVVIMLLYFFATTLAQRWGTRRLLVFLGASALIANGMQVVAALVVPSLGTQFYGGMVMADAATVAWAFANRGQVVRLFFVLPMRPLVMVGLLALWHILAMIARSPSPEGMVAPFGAMAAGWALGDTSPMRAWWLRRRLGRIEREVDALRRARPAAPARRRGGPDLRVIDGGSDEPPDRSMLH